MEYIDIVDKIYPKAVHIDVIPPYIPGRKDTFGVQNKWVGV
jgi:hypothetical protein